MKETFGSGRWRWVEVKICIWGRCADVKVTRANSHFAGGAFNKYVNPPTSSIKPVLKQKEVLRTESTHMRVSGTSFKVHRCRHVYSPSERLKVLFHYIAPNHPTDTVICFCDLESIPLYKSGNTSKININNT